MILNSLSEMLVYSITVLKEMSPGKGWFDMQQFTNKLKQRILSVSGLMSQCNINFGNNRKEYSCAVPSVQSQELLNSISKNLNIFYIFF